MLLLKGNKMKRINLQIGVSYIADTETPYTLFISRIENGVNKETEEQLRRPEKVLDRICELIFTEGGLETKFSLSDSDIREWDILNHKMINYYINEILENYENCRYHARRLRLGKTPNRKLKTPLLKKEKGGIMDNNPQSCSV